MAKKRVKIYKSPSGKGEYRNKLSNFLYIAEQGMSVPGARQQPVSRTIDPKQILTKEILRDYIVESLDDNYSDDQIRFAVMELTRAGHNPQLVDIALKEAIAIKDQNIAATDDDFKQIVNDVDSEELRRKKLEEESRLQQESDNAENEQIIEESFEDDDSYELDDESRDKIKRQLFFSDDKEETEEVNSKQLGGLVKMSLGGPGAGKSLIKLIGLVTDSGRSIKSADDIIQDYVQIVASEMKSLKNIEYDDLLKQDSFMNKVSRRIESDASSALKEINKNKKYFKKGVNLSQEVYNKLDSPLFKSNYVTDAQKVITDKTGKVYSDWVGAGTKSGSSSGGSLKGVEFEGDEIAEEILQTNKLSDDAPGVARNIDSEIKVIDIEDGNQQAAYIDALQSDAQKYFKEGKSEVTTSKDMQFVGYTTDGKPIVRVQRSDGNVINGIFSGGDGSYSFKPILGLSSEGTPIYSKADDVGVTGNQLAETFMKSKNNQITNTDKLDMAFRLGTEGQVKNMGPIPEGSVFQIDNATVISNPKTKYTNYSTDYVKGTPKGFFRNVGNMLTGQFNPRLLSSDSQFANRFSIPGYFSRQNAVVDAAGTPILDPRMGSNYFNNLRGGFGMWGDAGKVGADQNWLSRQMGYNKNITGFSDAAFDSRSIQGSTGYTPAQTDFVSQVQNPNRWFDNSTVQWAGRNMPGLSGRGTLLTIPAGVAGYNYFSGANDPYNKNRGFSLQLKEGQTETDIGAGDRQEFSDTTSMMNVNIGNKQLSVPKRIFLTDQDIRNYKYKIKSETGITPTNDQIPKELIENAAIKYNKEAGQLNKHYALGGMTKAQFVREGLKDFKRKFKPGGTVESPGSINQEESKREGNRNNLISAVQNNVAIDQKTKELEQQYDMLRNQESNTMNNYNPEGMQYAKLGAISKGDMRRFNRGTRRVGRLMGNMPSNMTNFETSGNIFNRKYSAEFDPTIPNMNPFAYGAGFGNMGMMLGNVIGQTINQVPTKFRVPLAQANNQAAISNTNVDREKAAQANLDMQQTFMYLEVLKNNPPSQDETLEEYKSRVNLGGVQITEEMFNMIKNPVKDLPGTNFPVISGCFGGNCADPNKQQQGGFVDSSNPDLYRFTGGGEEMMYALGGFPTAEEGIIVEGEEGMRPLPVTQMPTSIEQQTMLEYDPGRDYAPLPLPANPYGEASNIFIDPNMGTPAMIEDASPSIVFNQESQMFEEVAPTETPMVTVAPGEGAAPALLDTSKEAIDLAVSKAPAGMEIPDDVKAEGANAVSTYIMNQMKRGIQTKGFNLNVNPEIQGGLRSVQGEIGYEGTIGEKYNPALITANIKGGWNNPGYRGDGTDPSTAFQAGSNMWNVDANIGYTTKKSKTGSTWTGTAGVKYDRNERGTGEFKPTLGITYKPGSNQMGGEPQLPQNFLGGLGRLIGRGYAANPAFGRRMKYSGPQTMAGQAYYGNAGNLVKQEGKKGLFGRTKWTNTYAVPGSATTGPQGAAPNNNAGAGNSIGNYDMSFMQNRPDFNAPEEVDDRSRFEKRTDRLIDRKERREDRRDAREERRMDRKDDRYNRRDERKYERNRRRSIRQGFGDAGSYADDQARAEADNLAYEAQREKELQAFKAERDRPVSEPMAPRPGGSSVGEIRLDNKTTNNAPIADPMVMRTYDGIGKSIFNERVPPIMYGDKYNDRVYDYSSSTPENPAPRLMGNDNITFGSTGANIPTLQNRNPELQRFTTQRGAPSNTTQMGLMEQGVNAAQQYFAENPEPIFAVDQPDWVKAYGGPIVGDEVEMTEDEMRMFVLGGGVLEYI